MKFIYTLLGLLWTVLLWAQQPLRSDWIRTVPGNQFEENNSLALSPSGDVYTAGFFQNTLGGLSTFRGSVEDGFITKYNNQGQLIWIKQLQGSSSDRVNGIHVTTDQEVYLVGEFRDTLYWGNDTLVSAGLLDVFVAKMDSSGTPLWAVRAGDRENDSAHDIDVLPNGNLVLTGYHEMQFDWGTGSATGFGGRDIILACISPQGTPIWAQSLSGPSFDEANSVATDDYGNIYIAGSFRDILRIGTAQVRAEGGVDAFVARYNSSGAIRWAKALGSLGGDQGRCVQVDSAQNIVVVGWVTGYLAYDFDVISGSQEEDAFIVKLDSMGTVDWAKLIAYTFDERLYGVDFDQHDNIYILGTLDSITVVGGDTLRNRHLNRPTDIFVAKYSPDGTYRWSQTLGHYYNDFCYDLLVPDSRTLFVVGSFQDTTIYVTDTLVSAFDYDIFLGKFTMDTSLSVRLLPLVAKRLPAQLSPNPSDQLMWLDCTLEADGALELELYDAKGQLLWQRAWGWQAAGEQRFPIERGTWPAGLYYLHVRSETAYQVLPLLWR